MAVLQQPTVHNNPFTSQIGDTLAPAGAYIATVIDIKDQYGVKRTRYQSTEVETVDLTCFLFGFRDGQNRQHKVASRQMRISGNEKSALFNFLKSFLGRAPAYGWDYCTLKGQRCLLAVEHVQKRDGSGVFASIASMSPVPEGYGQPTPAPVPVPAAPQPRPQPMPQPLPPPMTAPAPVAPAAPAVPVAPSVEAGEGEIPF